MISFACWVSGFLLAFMPLYALGAMGLPRRSDEYFEAAYLPWTVAALFGAVLILAAMASLVMQLLVSIKYRERYSMPLGDPWNGRSLEWATPSPPPEYNFGVIPTVGGRDTFMARKLDGTAYTSPRRYEDIVMPRNSMIGAAITVAGAGGGFGLVWHIWWMAAGGLLLAMAAVIARSFVRNTERVIPAEQVRRETEAWLAAARSEPPATREEEMMPANHGLAEAAAA